MTQILISVDELKQIQARSRCLHTEAEVESAIDAMAERIAAKLEHSNPILLCVMNGGLIITGKLASRLQFPLQIDYLHATRYREQTSGQDLQWKSYPAQALAGRVVLLIDDILDEGVTLEKIVSYCREQGAEAVYTAALLDKQHDRKATDLTADFTGLKVEDFYLYGYGMDYKGYLRNAAGIFAIAEQDM
jgi:hypoxanthine phosphoribosyltransferase